MPDPDLRRVEEIFSAAVGLSGPERDRFVEVASAGDAVLQAYVRRLLATHDEAGGFLRQPTLDHGVPASAELPSEAPGTRIGSYKLLEKIGEGGFGTVFMAEQQSPVVRRVALKVIKLGMDTRQVIARFEAERQALAMMDHPNIARVFDAGATETGRPYFVMELVRGDPITQYADEHRLGMRERLELFQQVCRAVQHAHQKGIIHRDIKPSNVLVTVADGRPIAKMIDFGIAKATQSRLTEKTLFTEHRQLIGTPQYMSPEQADSSGADIDTRSDIYSLGVLLYELLTGTTPFDARKLRRAAFGEIQRIIREVEPERPSSRLQTLGNTLAAIADRRGVEPSAFGKLVRGDLDWIVMKAMEKDRARRYETAHGLSTDIDRHLRSEPVSAAPPSVTYMLRRFARRHRVGVLAGGSIAAVLVLGVIGTTTGMLQAIRAQHEQSRLKDKADEALAAELKQRALAEHEFFTGNLAVASAAINAHDSVGALRRLERIPESLRGWEWRHLHREADVSIATYREHDGIVRCLAVSPDGTQIASGSDDLTIMIRNAAMGTVLRTLTNKSPVYVVAWDPSGSRIASGGEDGTLVVWDAVTGEQLHSHRAHTDTVRTIEFSPDGTRIVSGSWNGVLKIWAAAGGDKPLSTCDFKAGIGCARFNPAGDRIAVGLRDGRVLLLDPQTLAVPPPLVKVPNHIVVIAFSPDGLRLASSGFGGSIRITDVATGRTEPPLAGAANIVIGLSFSPDGRRLASAGSDGNVRVWERNATEPVATLLGHSSLVTDLSFSRDGSRIFSCSADKTLKVWDARVEPGLRADSAANSVNTVAFSPDGTRIASVCADGAVRLWDSLTGGVGGSEALLRETVAYNQGDRTDGVPLAFDHTGLLIATSARDDGIALSDADTGEPLRILHGHTDLVRSLAFDPADARLASAGFDLTLRVWDVATGAELTSSSSRSTPSELCFSPEGSLLAWGEIGGVEVRDATSLRELWAIESGDGKSWTVAFSPDGSLLACCANSGKIVLCRARTGEQLGMLSDLTGFSTRAVFSADGLRLLSASVPDTSVRVWDTTTYSELVWMQLPIGGTHRIALSPDGSRLAQAFWGGEGGIRFLDTIPESERVREREALRAAEPEARRILDAAFASETDIARVVRRLREDRSLEAPVRRVVLHLLLARGLAEQREIRARLEPLRKENALPKELMAAVRADTSFPDHLRERALRLASLGSWPSKELSLSAWEKVKAPDASTDSYRRGLDEAVEAARLAPHSRDVNRTLGVAQYRVAKYESALATLNAANAGDPTVLAFLAMAQRRLGREEEADGTLLRLEALMSLDRFRSDLGAWACQQEAVSLLSR